MSQILERNELLDTQFENRNIFSHSLALAFLDTCSPIPRDPRKLYSPIVLRTHAPMSLCVLAVLTTHSTSEN